MSGIETRTSFNLKTLCLQFHLSLFKAGKFASFNSVGAEGIVFRPG